MIKTQGRGRERSSKQAASEERDPKKQHRDREKDVDQPGVGGWSLESWALLVTPFLCVLFFSPYRKKN